MPCLPDLKFHQGLVNRILNFEGHLYYSLRARVRREGERLRALFNKAAMKIQRFYVRKDESLRAWNGPDHSSRQYWKILQIVVVRNIRRINQTFRNYFKFKCYIALNFIRNFYDINTLLSSYFAVTLRLFSLHSCKSHMRRVNFMMLSENNETFFPRYFFYIVKNCVVSYT